MTRAGPNLVVSKIEKKSATVAVYNFTVADFHSYFVGNPTTTGGVWVHNGLPCPDNLAELMKNAKILTRQKAISWPVVQRYIARLEGEEVAPAIKVVDDALTEGNHRYVAGVIHGTLPEVVPGNLPSHPDPIIPWKDVFVDPFDWGNH